MIDFLLQLDNQIFLFLNHLPHNFLFDSFFAFLSGVGTGGIIWFVMAGVLFIWQELGGVSGFEADLMAKAKFNQAQVLVALILGIILVAFVEVGIKNIIQRQRPQFVIAETIVVGNSSNSYSFPSGHATMAFAATYILAKEHKRWAKFYYLLAILISFSRIYLGQHYPSDVLVGAILGLFIGKTSLELSRRLFT